MLNEALAFLPDHSSVDLPTNAMFERVEESEVGDMGDYDMPDIDTPMKEKEAKNQKNSTLLEERVQRKSKIAAGENKEIEEEKEGKRDKKTANKDRNKGRKERPAAAASHSGISRRPIERFDQSEMNNLLKGVEKFGFGTWQYVSLLLD